MWRKRVTFVASRAKQVRGWVISLLEIAEWHNFN